MFTTKTISVSVLLTLELVAFAVLSVELIGVDKCVQKLQRSEQIIHHANLLSISFIDATRAMEDYSMAKSPLFSDRYSKLRDRSLQDLDNLKSLIGANSSHQESLKKLDEIVATDLKTATETNTSDMPDDSTGFKARHIHKGVRMMTSRFEEELRELSGEEQKTATESYEAYGKAFWPIKCCLCGGVVVAILLSLTLWRYSFAGR